MGNLLFILLVLIGAFVWIGLTSYNKLQHSAQDIHEALSNISVAVSKKINLINQLLDVVKNYQDNEKFIHLTVSKDTGVEAIYSNQKNANMMMTNLQGLASRYPDLKANEQYHRLINNIESCELDISSWRNKYNACVKNYNTLRGSIPTVFVANTMGFSAAPYLDLNVEHQDENILKNFKTDDGEHLNALLKSAKNNLIEGSKQLASTSKDILHKATEAGKNIAHSDSVQGLMDKASQYVGKSEKKFFYLLPNGTPKGPVGLSQVIEFTQDEQWQAQVKLCEVGDDEWLDYTTWHDKYIESEDVEENHHNQPVQTDDVIDKKDHQSS